MLDTVTHLALNGLVGQNTSLDATIVFTAETLAYMLGAAFLVLVVIVPAHRRVSFFSTALFSALLARGAAEVIRWFIHRPRPFLELPTHPLLQEISWSFPSGHATFFFGLSTAIYLYNKQWGVVFYAASTLMVLARVAAGVHYLTDVVAGAVIGVAFARGVFALAQKVRPHTQIRHIDK